jgi:1-acyl-sn-glycerol-3-phosphate acyltransferase
MTVLRSALFNVVFFSLTIVLTLTAAAVSVVAPNLTLPVAALWSRSVIRALRIICGIRLEVTGLDRLPDGPALLASHHESALDTIVWLSLLPRPCYVLKQELLRIPFWGQLVRSTRMIAVDRDGGAATMRRLMKAADAAMAAGQQIVIFPEGTRAPAGTLLPLQPGIAALAARTGLPVVPVATNSGTCWGRRAFNQPPGTIRIVVRPPLPAGLRREALMQALRTQLMMGHDE